MGGEGSGRKPSEETIVKRMSGPPQVPIGDDIYIPNYSGVKDEAIKTDPTDITGGGGGDTLWQSGSGIIEPKDTSQTISGSGVVSSGTVSGSGYIDGNIDHDQLTNYSADEHFTEASIDLDNITEGTTNKFFTATDETKLDGIETAADVTDATNVAAAGAAMDGGAHHDGFSDFVANEHIDWTNASSNLDTSGTISGSSIYGDGSNLTGLSAGGGNMELIEKRDLTTSGSFTFTNAEIGDYDYLYVIVDVIGSASLTLSMRINNITSSNYNVWGIDYGTTPAAYYSNDDKFILTTLNSDRTAIIRMLIPVTWREGGATEGTPVVFQESTCVGSGNSPLKGHVLGLTGDVSDLDFFTSTGTVTGVVTLWGLKNT